MIKIENLVKRYGKNYALDGISFTVNKGEIVGFLGPNGAGKSTCMNILTGFLSSNSGVAEIDGVDILEHPTEAKKMVGYLPEQPPLYLDMTVDEYLNFVYELKHCTLPRAAHLSEICDVVKIKDVRGRVIRNLSKGYRQRVGIAQALIGNPEVIIFDEPTVGLDPKQIIEVRNLIRNLGKNHTVVLSTHILPEVQAVCDRIVVINKGKIVADGKTEDITRAVTENRRFKIKICGPQRDVLSYLRQKNGITYAEVTGERDEDAYTYSIECASGVDMRRALFFAMAEKGWPIIGLESVGTSLEDIFISLIDQKVTADKKNARKGER